MAQKQPKRPRDLNQWAKHMVDLATGEAEDEQAETPAANPPSLGGKARAVKLSPTRRKQIAEKAAKARWNKAHSKSDA